MDKLALVNASRIRVPSTHSDPALSEKINITHGPVLGFVGYPVSLSVQGNCAEVMDQWTTSHIMDTQALPVGEKSDYSLFWTIPYQALVLLKDGSHPAPTIDPSYDTKPFSNTKMPPTPNWSPMMILDDKNSKTYWEEMGRYIWDKVIMESGH